MITPKIRIGTAGWSIPRQSAQSFPAEGSSLTRYASIFDATEINSTFHRQHQNATLARWAASTPDSFRFAVKMPKQISHDLRLIGTEQLVSAFAEQTSYLGNKLGPLLLQLPPSLSYDPSTAAGFFKIARMYITGDLVCEPRHASWFDGEAEKLLASYAVVRAGADPARVPNAGKPGGAAHLTYYRLHGAPRMYYSSYDAAVLARLAKEIARTTTSEVWCIFDNTASGAAAPNALELMAITQPSGSVKQTAPFR